MRRLDATVYSAGEPDGANAVRFVVELASGRFVGIRIVREGGGDSGDELTLSVEDQPGTPPPPDATIRLTVPRGLVARAPMAPS